MTKQETMSRSLSRAIGWVIVAVGLMLPMNLSLMSHAKAQGDNASDILKAMSDYMASQKTISVKFDTDIEVITPDVQKIQFASSGQVQLSRPDKLRAHRTGGYVDVELAFDGKTLTIYSTDSNTFAELDFSGSVDQLVDLLRDEHGVNAPGADILLSDVFGKLSADVIDAKHIGRGVINGVECEHLAFRNQDTDWQIWIEVGERPVPCKYVITSKSIAGAPQYTLSFKEWTTDVSADAFAFNPAQGAKKVAMDALPHIDAVPPGSVATGEQK